MFGFTVREQVDKLLERAYQENMERYKSEIREIVSRVNRGEIGEREFDLQMVAARQNYLSNVSETVAEAVYTAPHSVSARYQLAIHSPRLAGVPALDDAPYCAGTEYCFLCYAFTGKPGAAKDAVKHNHLFAAYVDKVIEELEAEGNC